MKHLEDAILALKEAECCDLGQGQARELIGASISELRAVREAIKKPIPMLLACPSCNARHIDETSNDGTDWSTKPHHTHACQYCGMVWRPAIVCTVGVLFLPGFKNDSET